MFRRRMCDILHVTACPSGYEDRHGRACYVITNERLDVWTSAQDKCFDIGGYLLEVDNKEEQAHIRNLLGQGNLW